MANIETLDDVLNDIADKAGIYGACKSEDYSGCNNQNNFCCRVGFCLAYEDRIRQAVSNEDKLQKAGF